MDKADAEISPLAFSNVERVSIHGKISRQPGRKHRAGREL